MGGKQPNPACADASGPIDPLNLLRRELVRDSTKAEYPSSRYSDASYHPSVLLKLYICGYLNRVQSSRRLEREAGRNVEVMWLTGRLSPDHKTIADFRKHNGGAIRKDK